MKEKTCCFTGHRKLPIDNIENIKNRLSDEIDNLYNQGVINFISGGALGFDQIAATIVAAKKKSGKNIRLIFALPCRNQDEFWPAKEKAVYHYLLELADEIIFVSDKYSSGCMKKRNYYMVEMSAYCICALLDDHSGTAQTVRHAKQKELQIINVTE